MRDNPANSGDRKARKMKEDVTCFYCKKSGLQWRDKKYQKSLLVEADGSFHKCNPAVLHSKAIEKILSGDTKKCRFCGADGFAWSYQPKRGPRMVDVEGNVHVCDEMRSAGIKRKMERKSL